MVRKLLGKLLTTSVCPERAFGFPSVLATVTVLTAVALCSVCPLHALEGFAYTRDLDVPAAGWVRVPLDIGALRHMAPGGADLRVIAPDGRAVPFRLSSSLPETGRRPAQVSRGEDGGLLLDTGADPVPHERLVLDLSDGTVPALTLEASQDGTVWELLATGAPVRLRGAEGIQRVALSYPTTPARYLRLLGPADFPVLAAEVETVPGPVLALATQGARCASVCFLELPAGQILRRLALEVEGPAAVGYRLYSPRDFRWELLAEGVWPSAGRRLLPGGPQPIAGSTLRLELYGARLKGYVIDLAVPTVDFRASGPGRYLLAYGGAGGDALPPESRAGVAEALWLEPGPEQQGEPFRLPATQGEPIGRTRFASSWTVAAAAEPGELVRLELPPAVYPAAREDLADLRLAAEGRQVPFFRWSPPDPAYAGGGVGLRPTGSGESRAVVPLPSGSLPLTQVHLTAPAAPLRRPVALLYSDPEGSESAARATWECEPEPPLPCRKLLPLPGPAPRLLTVQLRDGSEPPLPSLGVSVWRRRDVLLFVWPEVEEDDTVRLLAGARDLEAPRYEIAALGPSLLGQPWRAAEIRSGGAQPEIPWWSRWVMPVAVTIVAAWLVWLLRRILSEA